MESAYSALPARNVLEGLFYLCDVKFAHRTSVMRHFEALIPDRPADLADLGSIVQAIIDRMRPTVVIDQVTAEKHLICEDLAKVLDVISAPPPDFAERIDPSSMFDPAMAEARKALGQYGISDFNAPVYLVDKLPEPYAARPYAVLTADAGDHRLHGIAPGVYVLADKIRPYFTDCVAAHEMVHVFLGNDAPDLSCGFFEEGIAELIGNIYLARRLYGDAIARRMFVMARLTANYGTIWDNYLDGTRQALGFVLSHGMQGLFDLMKAGRGEILSQEQGLLRGERSPQLHQDFGDAADDVAFMVSLLMEYPRFLTLSPLDFHVSRFVDAGSTVREIAIRSNMLHELCLEALRSMASRALMSLREDELVVTTSLCRHYHAANGLRYRSTYV